MFWKRYIKAVIKINDECISQCVNLLSISYISFEIRIFSDSVESIYSIGALLFSGFLNNYLDFQTLIVQIHL